MTEPNQNIKIIITEDQQLFRNGVKMTLANKPGIEIIAEAENGMQLMNLLKHFHTDIVILNINMPIMNGVETLPILRKEYPGIKVIILTMNGDPKMICRMIELGANAYLTKDTGAEQIYDAVLACNKNWFYINDTIRKAILSIPPIDPEATNFSWFHITEIQILKLLSDGKPIDQIENEIGRSGRSIQKTINNLKAKASVKSVDELIVFAKKEKLV